MDQIRRTAGIGDLRLRRTRYAACGFRDIAEVVPKGALLVAMYGATVGRVGLLGMEATTNQAVCHIIPDKRRADTRYMFHALQFKAGELVGRGAGGAQPNISQGIVRETEIPLPPLAEQKRIAAILDQADALRRLRLRALDRLNTLGQAIFQEMFGNLVSGQSGLRWAPVRELIDGFESGKNIAEDPDANGEARFRVLKVSAVTSGFFRPEESKPLPSAYVPPANHIVRDGDLLFSRANTEELIGATAFVRGQFNNLVLPDKIWRFAWRPESPVVANFVKFLFDSRGFRDQIRRRSTGTSGSMKNISQGKVLSIIVGLPPLDRQLEFSNRLNHAWTSRERCDLSLGRMEALFSSLQHRAFTGQI